jgi:hypothetical protein
MRVFIIVNNYDTFLLLKKSHKSLSFGNQLFKVKKLTRHEIKLNYNM